MKFATILIFALAIYGVYALIKNIIRVCKELKFKNKEIVDYDKNGKSDSTKS